MIRLICFVTTLAILQAAAPIAPRAGAEPAAGSKLSPGTPSFRVTTAVFAGDAKKPAARHLILFHQGLVYDLPQIETRVVTVFDVGRDRIILLDRESQVRTTLSTDSLLKLTAQARAAAGQVGLREEVGLLAKVDSDGEPGDYSIRYGNVAYQTSTQQPADPAVAVAYGRFADWAARLNIARSLGPPPFGRMTLNQRITADQRLPRETTLTLRRRLGQDRYRSTHEFIERLSESDRQKIDDVGGMLALYEEVDLDEFPEP